VRVNSNQHMSVSRLQRTTMLGLKSAVYSRTLKAPCHLSPEPSPASFPELQIQPSVYFSQSTKVIPAPGNLHLLFPLCGRLSHHGKFTSSWGFSP
jgi:hypothetical protein